LGLCGFFPLDDLDQPLLDQNSGVQVTYTDDVFPGQTCLAYQGLGFGNGWANHNYAFTTELRYWFQYQGNESLEFTGDDDVWVFINGTLAVAMPGIHNRAVGDAVLDASSGTAQITYPNNSSLNASVDLGLTVGDVYEVVVFQAERWCCGSNYMLTLANFLAGTSTCTPRCGDGVATGGEECDCGDGAVPVPTDCPGPNDDTTYGGCTTQCIWGPFCGDAVMQSPPDGPEECDLGKENGTALGEDSCSISCKKARSCGDGIVDGDLGEECDLGERNGQVLDADQQPVNDPDGSSGQVYCTVYCTIPVILY
jgi:fibro-slime domain-containing protein